jgi:hypothetical protein
VTVSLHSRQKCATETNTRNALRVLITTARSYPTLPSQFLPTEILSVTVAYIATIRTETKLNKLKYIYEYLRKIVIQRSQ